MTGSTRADSLARRRAILLILVVLLGLAGVADGLYLTRVHVDYELGKPTDLVEVCSQWSSRGCAVTSGRFGSLFGAPIALWGMAGAAATAVTAAVAWFRRREYHDPWRGTAFALASISVLASVVMATLSLLEGSFCPFCVGWYGINFALGLLTWLSLGDGQDTSLGEMARDATHTPGLTALAVFSLTFSAGYWDYGKRKSSTYAELQPVVAAMVADAIAQQEKPLIFPLRGIPTHGPEDATLTIVEVADFECPHCRRVWESVRDYSEHSTVSVRKAFVHYPLDDSCNGGVDGMHPHACMAARAGECAHRQERFWEYGDVMFARQNALERSDLVSYASELELDVPAFEACLDDDASMLEVRRSIARALLMSVDATPTFFVNGYKFRGAPPASWMPLLFDNVLKQTAAGATKVPGPPGTAAADRGGSPPGGPADAKADSKAVPPGH
ncbi:MAG: thioredoxin domain-containing protein [Deltaproteobacteria bacterium]|nr:thioredoxin domain-containing protein [Deltaproteobacteria bacterium]